MSKLWEKAKDRTILTLLGTAFVVGMGVVFVCACIGFAVAFAVAFLKTPK